ncbi:hypothetical protein BDQ17DRAFT_1332168 [Cyathus striatus]|nr:hypothetical protein BDQ17DRAFT_1438669 [Cyathus striatus]KAF8992586.1 hypothetical protein BDQ17DRAFT_1332168 [Cyathus striatus]
MSTQPAGLEEIHEPLLTQPTGIFVVYNTGHTDTNRIDLSVPGKRQLQPFRRTLRYFQDKRVEVVNVIHTVASSYIYINTEDQKWDKDFQAQVDGWNWLSNESA